MNNRRDNEAFHDALMNHYVFRHGIHGTPVQLKLYEDDEMGDENQFKRYRHGGDGIGKALVEAFGLPSTTKRFELHVGVDEIVTIHCEYCPKYSDGDVGDIVNTIVKLKANFSESFRDVTTMSDEARRFQQHDALSVLHAIARGEGGANVTDFAAEAIKQIKAKRE